MSTITKEQLIEKLQHRIAVAAKYPDLEEAQLDAAIFKIALASLEAEPVGYIDAEYAELLKSGHIESCSVYAEPGEGCIALYAAQPAAVSVPDELTKSLASIAKEYQTTPQNALFIVVGWNACRAAMLQGAERVTTAYKLRDAVETFCSSGIAIDADKIFAERDALNAPDCWCRTCRPITHTDMRFVVCPDCGNKRCPHANDHRNACTGSNEPGQEGSAYPAAPQQEV